jgi:WD40 repeat protein
MELYWITVCCSRNRSVHPSLFNNQKGPEAIKAGKRRKSYDKSKADTSASTGEGSGTTANGAAAGISSSNAANQNWGDPVLIAHLDGHDGVVTSLSYSRRGNRILSGSVDGFVRIWKYDDQSKTWTSMASKYWV